MPIAPTLTLVQATQMLQTALQNGGYMGRIGDGQEGLRSLALDAARIGAREVADARSEPTPSFSLRTPREAIRELFSSRTFSNRSPAEAFLARSARPEDGFSPFVTPNGTQIAFYSRPEDLGPPWSELARERWHNGLGLIAFANETADSFGMIFLHGAGKTGWSKLGQGAWQSSGGTSAFSHRELSFAEAMTRVMDKGVAMTLKWRAIDHSLTIAKHKTLTGLGGSAGILLHGAGNGAKRRGMETYAEVIRLLGITLTYADEGFTHPSADHLAMQAPKNVAGNRFSIYRGREPAILTAEGVFSSIKVAHGEFFGETFGRIKTPILVQGHGSVGAHLMRLLQGARHPVAGLIDDDADRLLFSLRKRAPAARFFDKSGEPASVWQSIQMWTNGVKRVDGLSAAVAASPEARIFSPNAGAQPITFDVAESLILGGFRAVVGAANHENVFDLSGAPESIAWILQAAGIFLPADFVVNRMGALAVVSDAIQLPFHDPFKLAGQVGDSVRAEVTYAFRKGIPPYLYELRRYGKAWNEMLSSGHGTGGRFSTP